MTPKKRLKKNRPHPRGWRWKNGAWRYRVPEPVRHLWDGKSEFKLGSTEAEAYRTWAARMKAHDSGDKLVNMEQALDRYLSEVVPEKAAATQRSNTYSLQRLRTAFQGNPIAAIQPHHIYQYRDYVARTLSEKHYNLDHEVLSHCFTKCIEWGARNDHPMTGKKVVKFPVKKSTRYVDDWELTEFLKVAPPMLALFCELVGYLGQDKADLLRIRLSDIKADGLEIDARHKTKGKRQTTRRRFFPFFHPQTGESTGLKELIDRIKKQPRPVSSIWLFCTRKGQPYVKEDGNTSGFDSIWRRAMDRALEETKLVERFGPHALRAKVASDAETDEQAQRQLDHTNPKITRDTYRRKPVVMPVAPGFKREE